jgi:tRNA (guanine37-N1)-methyltransferase
MRIDIITIFPDFFEPLKLSLIGKAQEKDILNIKIHQLRDFTQDKHKTVDDTPYGGGPGMVMSPVPWGEAIDSILTETDQATLIIPTPSGETFIQKTANQLATEDHLIFACGRYEGIDARVAQHYINSQKIKEVKEISLGNYVLNGGEVAAIAIIEAVTRLIPGVLGNEESAIDDSFAPGEMEDRTEGPVFTRPPDYALNLNGTSTTARTSGTTRVITTAAFTVEMWILYDGGNKGSYRNFFNQYVSSTNRIYVGLNNTNDNQLRFAWGGDTLRIVPLEQFTIPENQWFHVAMTRTSGGSVALYIDGAQISSPSATSTGIPNTYFQVGALGTSEYVPGQIDQVKVWNSALTAAQIRRSMHAYSNLDGEGTIAGTLAAHYDFNEGTGTTVSNRVGTAGTDLTVTAPAYSQDSIMTESVVGSDKVVTFQEDLPAVRRRMDGPRRRHVGAIARRRRRWWRRI